MLSTKHENFEATLSSSFLISHSNRGLGLGYLDLQCLLEIRPQLGEKMISIKGIYKIPSIKHVFFIVSSLRDFLDNSLTSQGNKTRMEYFGRILRSKDRMLPKANLQWTVKVVSEHDFLKAIKQHIPKGKVSPNRSSNNPEELELLAINLLKT